MDWIETGVFVFIVGKNIGIFMSTWVVTVRHNWLGEGAITTTDSIVAV